MKKLLTVAAAVIFAASAVSVRAVGNAPAFNESDVVFFGDSTTAHMKLRGGIPAERVWSGKANTVLFRTVCEGKPIYFEDEERAVSLAEAVREKQPKILVITLGVSGGAGFMPKEKFISVYENIIAAVRENSPDTRLFVQSILPLSDKSVRHYDRLSKQAVTEANDWIRQVCEENGVSYIDTHRLLTDSDGYLKKIYQNDEYMHLTSAAYKVIIENIYSFISNSDAK